MFFTEDDLEQAMLELLRKDLGYEVFYGPDVEREYDEPFDQKLVLACLKKVNVSVPEIALEEAVKRLFTLESGSLLQKNAQFMEYLQNGIAVSYHEDGEGRTAFVKLVDYVQPERNRFSVANQWTFVDHSKKRADMVIFVNGFPLVIIELKSPSREVTDVSAAYRQLRNYMQEIPRLFQYNAFLIISDGTTTKAGTLSSLEDRFMEWKSKDGERPQRAHFTPFNVLLAGMLAPDRLLDIIQNFLCFANGEREPRKILAAYHQYFAVKKAIVRTQTAAETDGRGGVFWHTQGSGKSLSMVFYAHLLQGALKSPTIVVLTDRNDLDGQLFRQFSDCERFLRQTPQRAESREHLRELLDQRQANGIFFTTIQKFEEQGTALSERRNIVVIADEAHRSQYGLTEKLNPQTGEMRVGMARIIRNNLPHATYLGFTGTPIALQDRNTREIFGDCIDIYDMTQAVEDGATRPVYYESRVIRLNLDQDVLAQIDDEYECMAKEDVEEYVIARSKRELGRMESILGAPETIESLCRDLIDHYENVRQYELTGKAMIVAYSRSIAMSIYRKLLELRPEWAEKLGVVMTSTNDDPEDWKAVIGNDAQRDQMAVRFKDNESPLKIVIVVDMWLTGFDLPSLATMYVYKPMEGHNLMQAITRVNRVFGEKEGGLIVDYVGIASALKLAMRDYTIRDQDGYGNPDIKEIALPAFLEKLEICRDLLHGYEYLSFEHASAGDKAALIMGAADFLSDVSHGEKKEIFIKEAYALRQALSLCKSLVDKSDRYESAFFEALRTILVRIAAKGKISYQEINHRINELLKQSIQSEGVLNLFKEVKIAFSLFDPEFLESLKNMKERNLALELLRKLIEEQLKRYRRTNLVQSEKFSETLQRLLRSYLNGLLTNEEVIKALLEMAEAMSQAHAEGEKLGLSNEELAFYDALSKPEAIKNIYEDAELIAITKELTDQLRKNRTIEWNKKETARAGMRRLVKRLLKTYKYPPEGLEEALETVIRQCELWTDHEGAFEEE